MRPSVELSNDTRSVARQSGSNQRLSRALIRLRVCAGWSEPLLVGHTSLLEISCPCSNMFAIAYVMLCMYTVGEGP